MEVQHAFPPAGLSWLCEREALAGLVAGHAEVVGHLVAGPADNRIRSWELLPVSRVGGQDAVALVEQDMGFGQSLQIGAQLRQEGRGGGDRGTVGHGMAPVAVLCQLAARLPPAIVTAIGDRLQPVKRTEAVDEELNLAAALAGRAELREQNFR